MSGVSMVGTWSPATALIHDALQQRFGVDGIVLEEPVTARERFAFRRRRFGLRTALGQAAFVAGVVPLLRRHAAGRLDELAGPAAQREPPAEAVRVPSVNTPAAVEALRALHPRVVVVAGTRIISGDVLDAVAAPFINVHAGITPAYRGVHGGYWALAEQDPERCGVTVHVVDRGVDTGGVLAQRVVTPTPADNFATYPLLQLRTGLPDLIAAVERALAGDLRTTPVSGPSRQWSHPTLGQYLWTRVRRGVS